jgi:hypothetical protein
MQIKTRAKDRKIAKGKRKMPRQLAMIGTQPQNDVPPATDGTPTHNPGDSLDAEDP